MNQPFTRAAGQVLESASEAAASRGQTFIGTEHILQGLTDVDGCTAQSILLAGGIAAEGVKKMLGQAFETTKARALLEEHSFSPKAMQLLEGAGEQAQRYHAGAVGTEHLLLALLKMPDTAALRVLAGLGGNR